MGKAPDAVGPLTSSELAERIARLDAALAEARALQQELRVKMAARARQDLPETSQCRSQRPPVARKHA